MPPEQQPEDNVELEAIAKNGLDTNDKLDGVEANTEATALKTNEVAQNTEAGLVQSQKNTEATEKVAANTDPEVTHKVKLEARTDVSKVFFEMIRGDQGERGDKGEKGDRGEKGDTGQRGVQGEKGADAHVVGPQGPEGQKGSDGVGKPGKDGKSGKDGKDGKPGKDGKDAPVKTMTRVIAKELTEKIGEKLQKGIDKDIERVTRHVASKSYSTGDLTDTQDATTGQSMVKQADGSWSPSTAAGSGDMTAAVYDAATITEQLVGLTATQTMSSKTLTSPVINTGISGTAFLDEDNMASDSATKVASQQSIKAYVDANSGGTVDTSGTPVTNDFARFTDADTIEGRSYAETKADLSLEIGTDVQAYAAALDAVTGTNTGDEATASVTVSGISESATAAEVDTGTDAVRHVTPSSLAGSALQTKVDGVEASADVTDTANVTSAGALMDSELTSIADVKALDQSVVSGAVPTFTTTNFTDATNKRLMSDAQETKLDSVESSADVTDATNVTAAGALMDSELTDIAAVKATSDASIAVTDTGTATASFVTPDGLQGSIRNLRFIDFIVVEAGTDVATGTSKISWSAPFPGTIVQDDTKKDYFAAYTTTAGTTGTMVVDIHKGGTTIMTTNKLDIETTELDTTLATTQPDLTTTTFVAGDVFTVDIDAVHTTAAKGLVVRMAVRPD